MATNTALNMKPFRAVNRKQGEGTLAGLQSVNAAPEAQADNLQAWWFGTLYSVIKPSSKRDKCFPKPCCCTCNHSPGAHLTAWRNVLTKKQCWYYSYHNSLNLPPPGNEQGIAQQLRGWSGLPSEVFISCTDAPINWFRPIQNLSHWSWLGLVTNTCMNGMCAVKAMDFAKVERMISGWML